MSNRSTRESVSDDEGLTILLSQMLGSGVFGTAFEGNFHGTRVAAKVVGVKFSNHASRPFSKAAGCDFDKECERMKSCKHDNIVQYIKSTTVVLQGKEYPVLVMTLMETDLRSFLTNQQDDLPPHKEIKIAHDIAKALNYLHVEAKFVHGDLHSGNVLLKDVRNVMGPEVRLCDFGLAAAISSMSERYPELSDLLSESGYTASHVATMSMSDSAPASVIEDSGYGNAAQNKSATEIEIRRFGTVTWEIHTRHKPNVGTRHHDNLKEIERRPLHNVVRQCWDETADINASQLVTTLEELRKSFPQEKDTRDILIEKLRKEIEDLKKKLHQQNEN